MPIQVHVVSDCFCALMTELSRCDRDHGSLEAQNTLWTFRRKKNWPIRGLQKAVQVFQPWMLSSVQWSPDLPLQHSL